MPAPRLAALFALLGLAACAPMAAAPESASAIAVPTAPPVPLETLRQVTETLSSDAFEGRGPGTPGEERTVTLLSERFAAAGLQPGNNGGWTQDVPLVEITADPATARFTIAGGTGAPIALAYGTDAVVFTKRVVPSVDVAGSELVFVGYGINAPERGWNDYEGVDVRGKTVVVLVNDPDFQHPTDDGTFDGRAMTYYGRWTYKYEEAARQGAAGVIIVHDTEPAAYGWNVVQSSWTGPQLDTDAPGNHMDRAQFESWVTNDAARRILAAAGQDLDALSEAARQPGFRAVPLGLTANVHLDNAIRRQASRNVIGVLPGSARPDEYILYTAHWDHLGHCTADAEGDSICNGALDNATGTAALVALAEMYREAGAPERSIAFVAVTAEESGLLGSTYYAANPVFPLAQTVGGINMDGLNIFGATRDVAVVGFGKSELEDYLAPAAQAQNRVVRPEPTPQSGSFYRSDHFPLARVGVPMLYVSGGEDLVAGGAAAGRAVAEDYTANRYHQPSDEYDPAWNWDGAVQDIEIYYQIGRSLADGRAWPNWRPAAEFRAARDASRPPSQ